MSGMITSGIDAAVRYGSSQSAMSSTSLDRFEIPANVKISRTVRGVRRKQANVDSKTIIEPSVAGSRCKAKSTDSSLNREGEHESVLLAEWDGYVLSYNEHSFFASLKGVHGEGVLGELEDAEIPMQDISESDLELLQPGAVFRLCVFRSMSSSGQPRRFTEVVFRRISAYRPKALEAAKARANLIVSKLRVE